MIIFSLKSIKFEPSNNQEKSPVGKQIEKCYVELNVMLSV